jgi:flagellar protein FliS
MTQLPASSRYLDARVSTASQPELQLMLLDGALRFGRQAQAIWNVDEQRAECGRLLARSLDVVEELVRGATLGTTDASRRLEAEYAFAFRQLAIAQLNRDASALEAALKVLDVHQETWKLACEKLRTEALKDDGASMAPHASSLLGSESFSLQG